MQATTAKDAFAPGHTRLSAHDAELVDQTLKEAIKVVENKVHFFEQEGLRKTNFVLGVMNLTLSAFIVGKWPEWYWVWYLFKALFMVVYKLLFIWYPRKEHYYFLDFCWVVR